MTAHLPGWQSLVEWNWQGNEARVLSGWAKASPRAWKKAAAAWVLMCGVRVALLSLCCTQALVVTSQQGHLTPSKNPEVSGRKKKSWDSTTIIITSWFWPGITCRQVITSWSSMSQVGHGAPVHCHHRAP